MKKLFITALVAVSLSFTANATDVINQNALNNFKSSFRNVSNVKWVSKDNFTKVVFTQGRRNVTAFYDFNGDYIATTVQINENRLPETVKMNFEKKYAGYTITEALHFTSNDEKALFIAAENGKEKIALKVKEGSFSFYSPL